MAKQTKLEDNFFISPDEFINEFKEAEKKSKKDLQFIESFILLDGKKLKTKEVFYKLGIIENEVVGQKIIIDISKSGERTEYPSKMIKFLKSESDKYFDYPIIVPTIISLEPKPTPLTITKEDFVKEFFAEVNEHEIVLVFPPDKKIISFVVPDKNREMVEYTINCSVPVGAIGTKGVAGNYTNPITFSKEETDLYFSFPQQPKEDLESFGGERVNNRLTQDIDLDSTVNFKFEEHYHEYKIDFIQELIDLSKKKNTTIFFDEENLLFTLEHKESKTTTIKLIIEYTSEEAVGQRYVNEEADYRAVFSKSESQSHLFFMNVGLNLANKFKK